MKRLLLVAAMAAIILGGGLGYGYQAVADYVFEDLAPEQPINFSHKIHAGDNEVACRFCHIYANKSKVSGVPSVERCMGCHRSVRTDSPEIQKLHKFWNNQEPVPWVKVYDLPDYIYFPHKRHVKADVACQECHGAVEEMARVRRVPRLVMGWCLGCHKSAGRNGPTDCWECHV